MKVIVAGFIKTGTKSVAAALNMLGYRVYDLEHHFYYLGKDWLEIFKHGGDKYDFFRMYNDVDAGCDVPFTLFWEEILEAFPDAKTACFYQHGNNGLGTHSKICVRYFARKGTAITAQGYYRAPKDRLLIFDLADGWDPLCSFLGKEIPNEPFPHLNKGGTLVEDWISSNPVFKIMQREMAVSGIILALVSSFGLFKLLQVLRNGGNGINFAAFNPMMYFK